MKYKDILKNNPFTVAIILFASLVSGFTFYYSKKLGIFELTVTVILSVFALKWISQSVERKKGFLRSLEFSLKESGELGDYTYSFPFPFLLSDNEGNIEWFNSDFEKILDEIKMPKASSLFDILPKSEKSLKEGDFSTVEMRTPVSDYSVYPAKIADNLFSLYFVENTELKKISRKFRTTRPCVLIINVDSLEQTEDTLAHFDYYSVVSDVEREITKWLAEYHCIFRKFADGKFFAVTERINLEKMIQSKFDILDKIRLYRLGDTAIDVTLSIGIGRENTFSECEVSARLALDMARGRGGDQVAVKVQDDYEFFGGITARKEKRGKIKSRVIAATLDDYIEKSSQVFVMGHSFSDFDAIGSAVGVAAIVKSCGREVHIVVNRKNSLAMPLVNHLEKNDSIKFISPEQAALQIDGDSLLIITDTMRKSLLDAPALLDRAGVVIIIDHHRMAVDHIQNPALLFHEPYASSACEMVTELIQYSPSSPKLSPHEAEALLSGIILDTKNFTLRVGTRTFEAAAYLKDNKADTVTVRKLFSGSAEENLSVSKLITEAEFKENFALVASEKYPSVSRLVASKAADELLNIEGVDASFVLSEGKDGVSVSARSLGSINVQLIMETFGGGGHQSMAACKIADVNLSEAKEMLKKAIISYLNKQS